MVGTSAIKVTGSRRKLDRKGRRFGFVRFWEVQNVERLLSKIEDTWFDTYKLRANLALHQRGDKYQKKGNQLNTYMAAENQQNTGMAAGKGVGGEVRQGVTFKQCLVTENPGIQTGKETGGGRKQASKRRQKESQILEGTKEVAVVEGNMRKFEKCWVGKLWDQNDAANIQFKIWMEGFQVVTAVTLGMDLVLLSSVVEDGV
ncbi:hypothetical protein TSUD_275250 [Trifolium subterraneum]|uniref:RRM domain-containing protein n=1 Tax=Trifolium subterraneum TaxID=3900 RepID=A0A2Z6MW72_TRISU|nr:hypothetical protein TSUD_275250 [Trifolium subterraneum]